MHSLRRSFRIITHAFLCGLCLLLGGVARAYDINYSPFVAGKTPPAFPLRRCAVVKTFINAEKEKAVWVLRAPAPSRVVLEITRSVEEGNSVRLLNGRTGGQLLAPADVEGWIMGDEAPEVSAGLLNEDAVPDFVLLTNSGGCGLGGARFFRLFMLSAGGAYQPYSLWTYNAGDEDFTDLDKDGRAEMIHTAFVDAEAGKDGRAHNYWVFHLLRFTGGKAVPADRLRPGFPCWILFTFKENHRPTDQLTDQQKSKAWKARVPDDVCPDAKDWPAQ